MAKWNVVVTDDRHITYEEEKGVLAAIGASLTIANCATPEEVIAACRDADGLIANLAPLPARVIQALPKCKVISRYGVGYDNVDVPAATAKGIYVTNVPDYCGEDVSDHTLALLLACVRRLPLVDRRIRAGEWNISPQHKIYRVRGKCYGLVGFGQIARIVQRKLKGFEPAEVLVFDPFVDAAVIEQAGARKVDLDTLCAEADFISVHAPLNDKTRGMIAAAQFARMKPNAILVNVSRGPVVDEQALLDALRKGSILGAGLDVYATEPLPKDHALRGMDNVVMADHSGWYTIESMAELKTKAAQNVADVLEGRKPKYPVNKL